MPAGPPLRDDPLASVVPALESRRRRRALVLFGVAIVVGTLAGATVRRASEPVAASADLPPGTSTTSMTTTTTSSAPPTPPTTTNIPPATPATTVPVPTTPTTRALTAASPEWQSALTEAKAFVSRIRERPFQTDVALFVEPDDAFEARVRRQIPPEELVAEARLLVLLGVIPSEDGYADTAAAARARFTQAFYEPDQKRIILRAGPVDRERRSTLVHELTHALDDQWFGLARPGFADSGEHEFAFKALVEGSATYVQNRFLGVGRSRPEPVPPSEQVMHPDKFLAHEEARPVDTPVAPPGARHVVERGPTGEWTTHRMLSAAVGAEAGAAAAAGWGGDLTISWDQDHVGGAGTQSCRRTAYVMDTAAARGRLQGAFERWAQAGPDRTVELAGDVVTITHCGPYLPPPPAPPPPPSRDGKGPGRKPID